MSKTRTLFIALAFLFMGTTTQAQFFKKLGKSAQKANQENEKALTDLECQHIFFSTRNQPDTSLSHNVTYVVLTGN